MFGEEHGARMRTRRLMPEHGVPMTAVDPLIDTGMPE